MNILSGMNQISDLEWLPLDKREPLEISLFSPPLIVDAAVPDYHLIATLVEARVEMEGQVACCGQIHCDPEKQPDMLNPPDCPAALQDVYKVLNPQFKTV